MMKITINNDIARIVMFEDTQFLQTFLDNLKPLNASHEDITAIEIIDIESTITSIPNLTRFTNLEEFSCDSAPLASLPELPKKLLKLEYEDCQLTSLPELPESLQQLYCKNNQLSVLPLLPASLVVLDCRNNLLPLLPELPAELKALICD
jgi:E3 ubiquitin-protein ligase SspH2